MTLHTAHIFERKANTNIKRWGLQDYETLALCIAEEAGEIAQAVLQFKQEGGEESRIFQESIDLGALCEQMIRCYEERKK